jgi:hypothetical protein
MERGVENTAYSSRKLRLPYFFSPSGPRATTPSWSTRMAFSIMWSTTRVRPSAVHVGEGGGACKPGEPLAAAGPLRAG